MSFEVAAADYDAFMGNHSARLAVPFADALELTPGQRALDVGCGPGAMTTVVADRLGAGAVSAVDPSESFVDAVRQRLPGVSVQRASAEELPFDSGRFDVTLAQLVVPFMTDPVAGITEMARVTRPGGIVAASAWDHVGRRSPVSLFWQAVQDLDATSPDESDRPGVADGGLVRLFADAGLAASQLTLTASTTYATFDDWWRPLTLGAGPAGAHLAGMTPQDHDEVRARCRQLLPDEPFTIATTAWAVVART